MSSPTRNQLIPGAWTARGANRTHAVLVGQCISATPRTVFLAWAVATILPVEIYGLVEDGTVSAPAMTCASRAFAPSLF